MKKYLLTAVISSACCLMVGAQKLEASKIPAAVKAAFAKQYPGINPKWENENGQFEAGFKQNGKSMSVLYSPAGTIEESEMDMKVTDLPASVATYIKEHYKGAVIKEAATITKANGTIQYEAEINKMDVLFDANGKFLKEVKD